MTSRRADSTGSQSGPVRLHPADLETIARRTAELLLELNGEGLTRDTQMVDAAEIARRFGVERGWVYAHANELGAVRLGSGRRPRLRFDLVGVATVLAAGTTTGASDSDGGSGAPQGTRKRRGRRTPETGVELLPIRGRAA